MGLTTPATTGEDTRGPGGGLVGTAAWEESGLTWDGGAEPLGACDDEDMIAVGGVTLVAEGTTVGDVMIGAGRAEKSRLQTV